MKVIDLLNKIANEEEMPKKIIIDNKILNLENGKEIKYRFENSSGTLNWDYYIELKRLNDEIEIIEAEKKIEKLELKTYNAKDFLELQMIVNKDILDIKFTLNEIIDCINEEKE